MTMRILVVDRPRFQLDIYRWSMLRRRYLLEGTYAVTVGKVGDETPHGMYFVESKTHTPDWKIPENPDYPKESWGTIVKFNEPGNPFAGGFISLGGEESGIGIHGTVFDPMVGTASSHGCVRMRTIDLLAIYGKCKKGTPVYLH